MTKPGFIIGAIVSIISGLALLMFLALYAGGDISDEASKYMFFSAVGIVIGIIFMSTNTTSNAEKQEYENYKRMREQEMAMYYRFANAKGTPIEEYTMDDRTKVMVYYDRLPPKYQKKIVDDVDRIYRQFENDLYTKR